MALQLIGEKQQVTYPSFVGVEQDYYGLLAGLGAKIVQGPVSNQRFPPEGEGTVKVSIDAICEYREGNRPDSNGCAIISKLTYEGTTEGTATGTVALRLYLIGSVALCELDSGLVGKLTEQAKSMLGLDMRVAELAESFPLETPPHG